MERQLQIKNNFKANANVVIRQNPIWKFFFFEKGQNKIRDYYKFVNIYRLFGQLLNLNDNIVNFRRRRELHV